MPDNTPPAEPRTTLGSRPAGRLRRAGKVPAVVYGLGIDTLPITVPARELQHILTGESGANSLITLEVDGESVLTLARQIHRHPTRGELVHVDFIRIRRDVAVSAEIPLHLTGEATGVRDGGLLEQLMFHLTIAAMRGTIPHALEIAVSGLGIGGQLRVADLRLATGVATELEGDTVVAQVAAPRIATDVEEGAAEAAEGEAAEGETPAAEASDDAGNE